MLFTKKKRERPAHAQNHGLCISGYCFPPTEFYGGFVRQQMLTNTEALELMSRKQVAQYLFYKVGLPSVLCLVMDVVFEKNFHFCLPSNTSSMVRTSPLGQISAFRKNHC